MGTSVTSVGETSNLAPFWPQCQTPKLSSGVFSTLEWKTGCDMIVCVCVCDFNKVILFALLYLTEFIITTKVHVEG